MVFPTKQFNSNTSFKRGNSLGNARRGEFALTQGGWQYRSREDKTLLPGYVLVQGSQNIVTNTAGRIQVVKGYTLDGAASETFAPILSSYDWLTTQAYERNHRAWLEPSDNKGHLQFRTVSGSTVTWRDLIITLNSGELNFTTFWDTTELIRVLLLVDGSSNIYEWSGGTTTYASATVNTLTKEGTTTWAQEGFYTAKAGRSISLLGNDGQIHTATYTGGENTTTLTGVSFDFTTVTPAVGEVIYQTVVATTNGAMTGISATFKNDLISTLDNQVYIASMISQNIYLSKINNYKDYSFSTPRLPGEGDLFNLDETLMGLIPQEDKMYATTHKSLWYEISFLLSADLTKEAVTVNRLKTNTLQGAQSQAFISHDKNDIIYVSHEPAVLSFGRVDNITLTPQLTDLSYPIVNDMNLFDFEDGSIKYHKNFIYVAVPKESVVLIYNQTDPSGQHQFWECPVTYPVSRFNIINGELYGQSYDTPETFKLFEGYNFNGQPIPALASFAYNNYGTRSDTKGYQQFMVEGYANANSTFNLGLRKELDGCATDATFEINGDDESIVCIGGSTAPLGIQSLGINPIGGDIDERSTAPKFRVIKVMPILPYFYELAVSFYSSGVDQQWEILSFGPALVSANDLPTTIKQG